MTDEPITVLLVDDHQLMREGLREILESRPGVVVVGEAGDTASAVALAAELRPRVVLLDVELPGGDVLATVAALRAHAPTTEIVILSMYDGLRLVQRLLALGIRGYLLKSVSRDELVSAVRHACRPEGHVTLSVSRDSLARPPEAPAAQALSPRERDVLALTARAMSNAQIATELYLAEATVKRHLTNIFAKLGAVSRLDAVNKAGLLAEARAVGAVRQRLMQ